MLRSRRLAFAAAALLVGLSACGDSSPRTVAGNSPVVIQLGGSSTGGGVEAATADKMMAPMQDITFVFDGDASKLGASGSAWTLPSGIAPDTARIAKMAELLGVDGEVRELPADQGGGWMIGAADYTSATLTVSADGMLSWWFNPAPAAAVSSVECVYVDPAIDVVPLDTDAAATTAVGEGTASGDAAVAPPDASCSSPLPPENVPDGNTALASAKQLFADMGYDNTTYEYEVYADEWGANVTAYLLLDGLRSPISSSVGYGADGVVTWASGSLATPVPAGEYPLVGADGGIARLNDETAQWGGYWGGPMAMSRMETGTAGTAADSASSKIAVAPSDTGAPAVLADDATVVAPTEIGTAGGTVTDVDPAVVSQVVPCEPETDCGYELPPMEPVTIHLSDVQLGLTMIWAADNTIWLLPAYEFSADDGGQYAVIAVDDSFIQLPAPYPTDTMPVETVVVDDTVAPVATDVPADTVVLDEERDAAEAVGKSIVGLPIDEATRVAEDAGVIVRVVEGDGAEQTITEDLRPNRLNVSVRDGVVANILSIG